MEKPDSAAPDVLEKNWEGTPSFDQSEEYLNLKDLED